MKTKKLLFGLIEMNSKMYNVLYTLLCIVVLFGLTICMFTTIKYNFSDTKNLGVNGKEWIGLIICGLTLIFIGERLFKNN